MKCTSILRRQKWHSKQIVGNHGMQTSNELVDEFDCTTITAWACSSDSHYSQQQHSLLKNIHNWTNWRTFS
jgi:hypothetical protein